MNYLVKKAPDLCGAGLGDYFVGFTGSGIGMKANWGPKAWAKPMSYSEACKTVAVWPPAAKIAVIEREQ